MSPSSARPQHQPHHHEQSSDTHRRFDRIGLSNPERSQWQQRCSPTPWESDGPWGQVMRKDATVSTGLPTRQAKAKGVKRASDPSLSNASVPVGTS